MSKLVPFLLLVVAVVASCGGGGASTPSPTPSPDPSPSVTPTGPTGPSAPAGLAGTGWKALTVDGQPVVAGHEPTAMFSATEVVGTTGCNSYGGSYTFADGKITFGPLRTTLMACDGPINEVEGRFTAALTGATTVTTDARGHLVIDGTAGSIVFVGRLT